MSEAFRRPAMTRQEIKETARRRLSENKWPMVGAAAIESLIIYALASTTAMSLFAVVVEVMAAHFFMRCWRGEKPPFSALFEGAFTGFWRKFGGMMWMALKTFLWTLLFIVPGIIKSFAYSMTPYLLALYPNIPAMDACGISEKITDGYKMDIFIMMLSFIGWALLSALTFGLVGIFFSQPYYETSMAGLYDEILQNALQEKRITPEMLEGAASVKETL